MGSIKAETKEFIDQEKIIEEAFGSASDDPCSISNLTIPNNINNITDYIYSPEHVIRNNN